MTQLRRYFSYLAGVFGSDGNLDYQYAGNSNGFALALANVETNGVIRLPPGTIAYNDVISPRPGVTIEGAGMFTFNSSNETLTGSGTYLQGWINANEEDLVFRDFTALTTVAVCSTLK